MKAENLQNRGRSVVISSGVWLGFLRWQKRRESRWVGVYSIPLPRLGIIIRRATDGTPWTFEGRRYHFRHSDGVTRFALGKYAAAIHWGV